MYRANQDKNIQKLKILKMQDPHHTDNNIGLKLYLVFVASWFLHLGSRFPILGIIRFDLILVIILIYLAAFKSLRVYSTQTKIEKILFVLIAYAIISLPLVQWPGSVINTGIPNFIKAVVFYFFTVAFVRTEKELKLFIFVFLFCQTFRILEPLYLHITEGYWGSYASMANWEYLNRLSGAPYDIINPNGLAYLICMILPFFYYFMRLSWVIFIASSFLIPASVYALALTGSRSGFIGIFLIFCGIVVKSRRPILFALSGILIAILGFSYLDPNTQDRYLSIIGKGEKNQATAEGRMEGLEKSFIVALRNPIFGYGLGTSREANANYIGIDQPAHNLYGEVAIELGFLGMTIFIIFIKVILFNSYHVLKICHSKNISKFYEKFTDAIHVWLFMNIIFSFATYGLSSYEWYLFAGFSELVKRFIEENNCRQN